MTNFFLSILAIFSLLSQSFALIKTQSSALVKSFYQSFAFFFVFIMLLLIYPKTGRRFM
nr:MAG TPA: hypothetical protein [Caudoviricetes sp.]